MRRDVETKEYVIECPCGGYCGAHTGVCTAVTLDGVGWSLGRMGMLCPACTVDGPGRAFAVHVQVDGKCRLHLFHALPYDFPAFQDAAGRMLDRAAVVFAELPESAFDTPPEPLSPEDHASLFSDGIDYETALGDSTAPPPPPPSARSQALRVVGAAALAFLIRAWKWGPLRWYSVLLLLAAPVEVWATWAGLSGGAFDWTSAEILHARAVFDFGATCIGASVAVCALAAGIRAVWARK